MSQALVRHYLHAKRVVIDAGFAPEIVWQEEVASFHVTAASFLEQAAWVVLSAGMAERVVSQRFPDIRIALHQFDLGAIEADPECRQRLLGVFHHRRKIDAILTIPDFARARGDDHIRDLIMSG